MKFSNHLHHNALLNFTSEDTSSWLQLLNELRKRPPIIRAEPTTLLIEIPHISDPALLDAIIKVVNGEALAIRIPNAYEKSACEAYRKAIDSCADFVGYAVEPSLERVELPLYEAAASGRIEEYFSNAFESTWAIQKMMGCLMAPTTMLRVSLDNLWGSGASILRVNGRACPFGINRRVKPGGSIGPHSDMSEFDYNDPAFVNVLSTLSFLVYCSQFEGGELELWPDTIINEALYQSFCENTYALKRSRIGEPSLTLKPEEGDAILFDARRFHAVRPVVGNSDRYSSSGFIQVTSLDAPLSFYC